MTATIPTLLSLFSFGNSLTVKHTALEQMIPDYTWGFHTRSAASLTYMLENPTDLSDSKPGADWRESLQMRSWDYVSVQPFGDVVEHEIPSIKLVLQKAPTSKLLIYMTWPVKPTEGTPDYQQLWKRDFDETNSDTRWTQDNLSRIVMAAPDAIVVRAGHTLAALDVWAKAGLVPGISDAWGFYSDHVHLNGFGSYLVTCCYYTALLGLYPPAPVAASGSIPLALSSKIREAVWIAHSYRPTPSFESTALTWNGPTIPGCKYFGMKSHDLKSWTLGSSSESSLPLRMNFEGDVGFFSIRY